REPGRGGRAASPSPRRALGRSGTEAGRSRSARTREARRSWADPARRRRRAAPGRRWALSQAADEPPGVEDPRGVELPLEAFHDRERPRVDRTPHVEPALDVGRRALDHEATALGGELLADRAEKAAVEPVDRRRPGETDPRHAAARVRGHGG